MKKVIAAALLLVISVAMFSCKSHERCPAYGKAPVESAEKRA